MTDTVLRYPGFDVRKESFEAWCTGCDQITNGPCYSINKLEHPSKGSEYICSECLPFVDEAIAAYPCALIWQYYDHPMTMRSAAPQPVFYNLREKTKTTTLSKSEGKRLGFEKWACDKCDLVFTNREAKMRHIDEKHRI